MIPLLLYQPTTAAGSLKVGKESAVSVMPPAQVPPVSRRIRNATQKVTKASQLMLPTTKKPKTETPEVPLKVIGSLDHLPKRTGIWKAVSESSGLVTLSYHFTS